MRGITASVTTVRQIDQVLAEMADGRMDWRTLKKLPPWRAVVIARIARRAGIIAQAELHDLTEEAISVGPEGELKPYRRKRRSKQAIELEQRLAEEPPPVATAATPPLPRDTPEWTQSGMIQKSVR